MEATHQTYDSPARNLCIAAMILGLLSLVLSPFTAIPAIICGHMALGRMKTSPMPPEGRGFAITGLVLGYVTTFILILFVVLYFLLSILFLSLTPAFFQMFDELSTVEHPKAIKTSITLKESISSYRNQLGKFPVQGQQDTTIQSNEFLMHPILGDNPQKTNFFSQDQMEKLTQDDRGYYQLLDPWGHHFRVALDLDGDGVIPSPYDSRPIGDSILVWSPGPDGIELTADDVRSW